MTTVAGFAGQGKSYVEGNLVLNLDPSVNQSYNGAENLISASGPGYFGNTSYYPPINGWNPALNYSNAPDGTQTSVQWAAGGQYVGPYQNYTVGTPVSGKTYVMSVYGNAPRSGNNGQIWFDPGNNRNLTIDCNSGTIVGTSSNIINSGVIDCGNGWYRFWGTWAGSTGGTGFTYYTALGGGTNCYLWGPQIEQGVYPGPYTPTFGSVINRSNTWNDLSGNSNNASLNMSYFNETGYFELDGNSTTAFGSVANSTSINFSESAPYSVELMAYAYTNQPGGSGGANNGEAAILEKWNFSGSGGFPFCIRLVGLQYSPPSWYVSAYNGTLNPAATANATRNAWTHITAVYDWPNSILRLYINGAQASSTTLTVGSGGFSSPTSPLYLGQRYGSTADRFAGKIGHIRLYNKALSAAEISQNFNAVRGRFGI
jgi:hypothetical protein